MNEELFCKYARSGILEIDSLGRVWRIANRVWDIGKKTCAKVPCAPRRAEKLRGGYFYVRMLVGGKTLWAQAHRLVWWYFNGPIPEGLSINHKNGITMCNELQNLELATPREQYCHAKLILRRSFLHSGEEHYKSKLSDAEIDEIRRLKLQRWKQKDIAAKYGVSPQFVSSVIRGNRRAKNLPSLLPPALPASLAVGTFPVPCPPHAADES